MQMQIEGQEITYKDLPDLREKLPASWSRSRRSARRMTANRARLGRQEKKIRSFWAVRPRRQPRKAGP